MGEEQGVRRGGVIMAGCGGSACFLGFLFFRSLDAVAVWQVDGMEWMGR